MSQLRQKMMHDLAHARLAKETQERYVATIERLAAFHRRSPDALSQNDLRAFIEHLEKSGIGPSRLRQHFGALRFLYRKTLARPELVSASGWRTTVHGLGQRIPGSRLRNRSPIRIRLI